MKKMLFLVLFLTSCVVKNEEDESQQFDIPFEQVDVYFELIEPDVLNKFELLDPYVELERLNNEVRELLDIVKLPREKQAELKKIDIRAEYMRLVSEMYVMYAKTDWCVDIIQDDEYLEVLDMYTNEINWGDFE